MAEARRACKLAGKRRYNSLISELDQIEAKQKAAPCGYTDSCGRLGPIGGTA